MKVNLSAIIVFLVTSFGISNSSFSQTRDVLGVDSARTLALAEIHFRFEIQDAGFPVESISCIVPNSLRFTDGTPKLEGYYTVSVNPAQDVASNDHGIAELCAETIKAVEGVNAKISISNSTETTATPWADTVVQ